MSTPVSSGVKRKSEDNYRRPSSLTSKQYDALKKQKQTAHAAYAAIEASIDEILNSYESNGEEETIPSESILNDPVSTEDVEHTHLDLSFE
jgi:predicted  nucleic acid-binding Zn-ribbon protein